MLSQVTHVYLAELSLMDEKGNGDGQGMADPQFYSVKQSPNVLLLPESEAVEDSGVVSIAVISRNPTAVPFPTRFRA